eukprot:m.194092 g.194092  ORF g.194092 m.194092 type:complete len:157 (+) comp15673_c0_seq5:4194-4664(+)
MVYTEFIYRQVNSFRLVLIADSPLDAYIMLRRELCWDRKDLINLDLPILRKNALNVPKTIAEKIRKFNAADQHLYTVLKKKFLDRVEAEIYMDEEREELGDWIQQAQKQCAHIMVTGVQTNRVYTHVLFYRTKGKMLKFRLLQSKEKDLWVFMTNL